MQVSLSSPTGALHPVNKTRNQSAVHFSAETTPAPSPVKTRKEGSVQYITMDHPEKANRLSREMIHGIDKAFRQAEADPEVKQIVLESGNEKLFSPGADLFSEMKVLSKYNEWADKHLKLIPKKARRALTSLSMLPSCRRYAMDGHWMHKRIANSPKVTIAKVNGYAVGGGVELGLVCDYIMASSKAKFAIPEVKYGIYPDWGATERLPQRIGRSMARFLILEGGFMADKGIDGPATITAQEANQLGIVDLVVPPESLDSAFKKALEDGVFSKKVSRPTSQEDLAALDEAMKTRVAGTRFAEKYERYRTASLDDLMQKELKGLYPPAVRLTNGRIDKGPKISRYRTEKELFIMFRYFAKVAKMPKKD